MRSLPFFPRVLFVVAGSACSVLLTSGCLGPGEPGWGGPSGTPSEEFRGMFVATAYNIDWPSKSGLHWRVQMDEMRAIVNRAKELNCNVILLQVRAFGDRIHKSSARAALEPWSPALTMLAPENEAASNYDPLGEWIRACHDEGIRLYAWVNPFRVDRLITYNGYMLPVVRSLDGKEMYLHPESGQVHSYVLEVIRELLGHQIAATPRAKRKGLASGVDGLVFDHNMPGNPEYGTATRPCTEDPVDPRICWMVTTAATQPHHPEDHLNQTLEGFLKKVHNETRKTRGVPFGFSPRYNDNKAKKWLNANYFEFVIPELYFKDEKEGKFERELRSWLNSVPDVKPGDHKPLVIVGLETEKVQAPTWDPKDYWSQQRVSPWSPEVIEEQIRCARRVESERAKVRAAGQVHYDWRALRSPEQGGPAEEVNIGNRLKKELYSQWVPVPPMP